MGEVYLAVDQRLGSAVALKRTFFTEDNTLAAAFEREARILARLRHPVLPKVIDHFVEGGDQFLVMEHISGDDLSKRLESAGKPFPLSWVMFWADQLLDALSYLHSHEPPIVHRDIKPQNLKLTDDNHIVLLDFGLSKDFDTKATSNPLNSASVAGYSPHFASMEQIRGTGTDNRSDIYSLAATLYQLLANIVPLDALSRADALLGGKADPIVPLDKLNPEVTPAISEVLLKGVAVRQDERYSTAGEMQKALRRAFDRGKRDNDAPDVPLTSSAATASASNSLPSEDETRAFAPDTGGITQDTGVDAFEATLEMNAMPVVEEVKQSDVKTEMFTTEDIPEVETRIVSKPPEAAGNADGPPATAEAGVATLAAEVGSATQRPQVANPTVQPHVPASSTAKVKASSSKTGFIIGGLIGLFVLAVAGAGGGYYLYTRNAAIPAASPSPVPSAQPSASGPVLTETDKNTNSAPANAEVTESKSDGTNSTTSTNSGQTSSKTAPQTTTKTQPVKTPQSPAVKATPKTKPKDDRTVIIQ